MTDLRETIRLAIAAKCAASSGLTAAGVRKSDTRTDDSMILPAIKVLRGELSGDVTRPNANLDFYDLDFPAEILVGNPGGRARSAPNLSTIIEALKVEFRSGITLGLSPTVSWCFLQPDPSDLEEYADKGYDGGRVVFQVRVTEVFNPGRTA